MVKREEGPDQARSWAIAFAACIINSVLSGISRTTGLFYVALIETYGVSRLQANLPFTLRNLLRNLGGPLVGAIGQRYGPLSVTITGSFLGALGIILCTFAPNVIWICVLWGGMHGFGVALANTLFQIVVNQYFLKYRATASGFALSGACIGAFLFPILIEYLLINVGLSGTFLLTGGIIMHALPASLMIKEPPWIKRNIKQQEEPPIPNKTSYIKAKSSHYSQTMSMICEESVIQEGKPNGIYVIDAKINSSESSGTYEGKVLEDQFFQTYNMDKFNKESGIDNPSYDGSKIDLNERTVTEKEDTTNSLRMRTISISDVSVSIAMPPDSQQEVSIYKGVIKMISDPMFHMISLSLAAFAMLFDPSITVIVDYLNDKGLKEDVAKYFISMLSLSDLIGRLCFGWVTDRNYLSLPKFMMLIQVLQGICFLLIPIFYSFDVLMTLIVIYGMAAGATLVMFPILVGKYLISVQSLAIGCISFLSGMLTFGIPPLIGYFRDNLGSYDGLFYITGGLSVVVGLMWLLEPLLLKINFRLKKPGHSASVVITP
ncbi:monocarboxylate transporter 5-like [Stegodyphus dumicola]|uniref:monocarboxylate transporter 5-like n=1 Tax=Stegodyphus dumicola TaxID=202533 RepID=UPI0015AC5769|nr:monocarboxylate transporter 5-like [Stegodyphus dumicola]XP_035229244.1 monocarboxylate transporter 5-like [Stegodyphus dumicola]